MTLKRKILSQTLGLITTTIWLQFLSNSSTPQVTEAHLKEVLDTLNKSKYVPPGSSSTFADKDKRLKVLEARVGVLEAQVCGLQGQIDTLQANDNIQISLIKENAKQSLSSRLFDEDEQNVEIEIEKDLNEVTYQTDNDIEFNPKLMDTVSDIEGSLESEQDLSDVNGEPEVVKPDD
ncbi:hypothetical protein L1987_46074 [Smallanthus sonchifolius]|uniref:Uncharacterized protein n=1 Tax=Smallanthus sonchifolius TaxID=185202 RepID=A0ACB9FZQ8_9ASTR|nr:hypothetical protein L1987_46074 [Smallanthus sonchifolius]